MNALFFCFYLSCAFCSLHPFFWVNIRKRLKYLALSHSHSESMVHKTLFLLLKFSPSAVFGSEPSLLLTLNLSKLWNFSGLRLHNHVSPGEGLMRPDSEAITIWYRGKTQWDRHCWDASSSSTRDLLNRGGAWIHKKYSGLIISIFPSDLV